MDIYSIHIHVYIHIYTHIQKVLISIQSLILVPQPYFNEPGYQVRTFQILFFVFADYQVSIQQKI